MFEGVLHFCACLLGVALGLVDATLNLEAVVSGGSAEDLLDGAPGGLGLVRDLFSDAHVGVLSLDIFSSLEMFSLW